VSVTEGAASAVPDSARVRSGSHIDPWESGAQARILVALSGAALDRIRLMKTLFMVWYRGENRENGPFYFEPYLYGPCSFEVYRELDKPQVKGLVVQAPDRIPQRSRYHLTVAGKREAERAAKQLGSKLSRELQETARWSAKLTFRELLAVVYSSPEFATRSVAR
jgi:hypothetical protein